MKFDRSAFSKQSFKEANDSHQSTYILMDEKEKVEVFHYLMAVSYGFLGKPWPKMERTYFSKRKFND